MPIIHSLGITDDCVFCNRICFKNGEYIGFERELPINQPSGKRGIIQDFMQQHHITNAVMIGDGSTDLETLPVVDCFIGYGGVVERPIVKEKASAFITSFEELHSLYSTPYRVCNKHWNYERI